MHTASDVFVMLKAGRSGRVARHEKALPLIIDPCPDKKADNSCRLHQVTDAGSPASACAIALPRQPFRCDLMLREASLAPARGQLMAQTLLRVRSRALTTG
jgi:hypothetical protein